MATVLLDPGRRAKRGRPAEQPDRRAATARRAAADEPDTPDLAAAQGIFLGVLIALPIHAGLFLALRALWRALG